MTDTNDAQQVRLESLGDVEDFSAYVVDGDAVRATVDKDFRHSGNFTRCRYIPPWEVWVEEADDPAETEAALIAEVGKARRALAQMSDDELNQLL